MESDGIGGEVVLIGLAVLLHGIFNGAEVALLSAQKSRLQQWKDERRRGATEALLLFEAPERFLITIQIVMTCTDVFAAVLAGAVAILKITPWIVAWWALPEVTFWAHPLALGLVMGTLAYVGLIVGQLVPKAIALQHAEQVLCWMARPLILLTKMAGVVRGVLTVSLTP
jgi:putative hemolysin